MAVFEKLSYLKEVSQSHQRGLLMCGGIVLAWLSGIVVKCLLESLEELLEFIQNNIN